MLDWHRTDIDRGQSPHLARAWRALLHDGREAVLLEHVESKVRTVMWMVCRPGGQMQHGVAPTLRVAMAMVEELAGEEVIHR